MEPEVASVDLKTYVDQASGTTKERVNVLYHHRWTVATMPPACLVHPNAREGQEESLCEAVVFLRCCLPVGSKSTMPVPEEATPSRTTALSQIAGLQ